MAAKKRKKPAKKAAKKPAKKAPGPKRKPWERQQNETGPAFAAFREYRDMGPAERSLAKAGRALGKSKVLLEGWSSKHDWVERARAWDQELDRRRLEADARAIEEMRARHIKTAMAMQGLGETELRKLQGQADGGKGPILTPENVRRLLRDGTTMERLNRGEPGELVGLQRGDDDRDLSNLSDEELLEMKRLNRKARGEVA